MFLKMYQDIYYNANINPAAPICFRGLACVDGMGFFREGALGQNVKEEVGDSGRKGGRNSGNGMVVIKNNSFEGSTF